MARDTVEILDEALAGRYRITGLVGEGGMALVYRAEDLKHHRPVAIKVLRPERTAAIDDERFRREIAVAASLNHPNILSLIDSGEAEGLRYFVMPFVQGETLETLLSRNGPLEVDQAVEFAREIAGALAHAHEQGLVHRDVKPSNILLQAGHAVVADFGIAKVASDPHGHRLTRTGTSIGTLKYMSPEQLAEAADIDGRTDVYSLGCVLVEMLEGVPPFEASSVQASMTKKILGELPERSRRADVPDGLWHVAVRALQPDASERYQDVESFRSALADASKEAAAPAGRGRSGTGFALGAAAAVVVVGAGLLAFGRPGEADGALDRLAVLPLENVAGDPGVDFYVRGVHEDLVSEMQRAGLRVVNPSATRSLTDRGLGPAEVATELSAEALIEGSVERIGPRVVLDLRLVDGETSDQLWSTSLSGAQEDVVELLRRATLAIAEETGAELDPGREAVLRQAAVVDAVLYELLLQGRYEAFGLSREGLAAAERYYERAIERDSMSAEAWRGLVGVWGFRAQEGLISADEARMRRDSILARAPVDAADHRELALQLTWFDWQAGRWDEAEDAFLLALEERPSDASTRAYYALLLLYLGREAEAEREATRASAQAPDDGVVQALYGQFLNATGRYEDAERVLTSSRDLDAAPPFLESTLRATYHLLGDHERAIASTQEFYRRRGDIGALTTLTEAYAAGGYENALRSVAELFEVRRSAGESVSEWQIGTLYTRAGMPDKAFEYLELAVAEGDTNAPYLTVDRIFDPLREDPRFDALLAPLPR